MANHPPVKQGIPDIYLGYKMAESSNSVPPVAKTRDAWPALDTSRSDPKKVPVTNSPDLDLGSSMPSTGPNKDMSMSQNPGSLVNNQNVGEWFLIQQIWFFNVQ